MASVERKVDAADVAALEALWKKVLADFGSEAAHEAFLRHCSVCELLPEAARRYRAHKEAAADDATRAAVDVRLAAITAMALAQIDTKKGAIERKKPHPLLILLVAIAATAAMTYLVRALFS
jgi:hypothetical protein